MIIGITGLAGSGKDTIGHILVEEFGFKRLSCATKVKDIAAQLYGWDRKKLEGLEPEDRKWREEFVDPIFNITPRKALIKIGEGLKSILDDRIWSNIVKREILENGFNDVVITDVRFPSEIALVRELKGEIIRVERGQLPSWFHELELKALQLMRDRNEEAKKEYIEEARKVNSLGVSKSEYEWIGFDMPSVVFKNNRSLEDFQDTVRKTLNCILEK